VPPTSAFFSTMVKGTLQPDAGQEAGHAGADDHHRQVRRGGAQLRRGPVRALGVLAGHLQLFHQEGGVALGDLGPGDEVHHLAHHRLARDRRQRLAGQVGLDGGLGPGAEVGLDGLRIAAAFHLAEGVVHRPAVATDQAGIAGQVDQGRGHGRQVRVGEGGVEGYGVIGHGDLLRVFCAETEALTRRTSRRDQRR
jgi:hypothetical protein